MYNLLKELLNLPVQFRSMKMIITTQVVTEDWESEAYYKISTRPTSISTLKRDKGSRSRWILTPINANHAPIKVRFLHLIRFNNSFESFTFSRKERNYYLSIIFLMNNTLIFSDRNLSVKEGTANRKIGRKLVYGEKDIVLVSIHDTCLLLSVKPFLTLTSMRTILHRLSW